MNKLRGREAGAAYALFVPPMIAANALFLWGAREVSFPPSPVGIAIQALWLWAFYVLFKRSRRMPKV
jgi:hypothetical protein